MKKLQLVVLAISMLFSAAQAGQEQEEHETRIKLVIADENGDEETTVNWTSTDPGEDLHNMQVGENRSIVDDSGRAILVTKEEDGLRFDVDGKSVVVPNMDEAHGTHMAFVAIDDLTGDNVKHLEHDVDINITSDHAAMTTPGVMIITDQPLDAATQDSIKAILLSAGEEEVTFIDGDGEQKHVKVIRKRVEVAQ